MEITRPPTELKTAEALSESTSQRWTRDEGQDMATVAHTRKRRRTRTSAVSSAPSNIDEAATGKLYRRRIQYTHR